ncbi:MAG: LAGLIDADG family homing endonuclease [Candidatus Aenigmarchaeota archaeon]|nr:LAGLIDADG family homing endonuclease [Candidatus Aenigmarchaeota archaeon]
MEILGYAYGILVVKGVKSKSSIHVETSDEFLQSIAKQKLSILGEIKTYKRQRLSGKTSEIIVLKISQESIDLKLGRREWDVPSRAFTSNDFRRGFLRSVFDFAGSLKARKRKGRKERAMRLCSVNENGLKKIKELLRMEGIKSIVYKSGNNFVLEIFGKHNLQLYLEKIGFENQNKKILMEKLLDPVNFDFICST